MRNGWTGGQYSLFRAALGAYLCIHFVALLPYGTEIFSSQGVLPDGNTSPLLRLFPNILALSDGPWFVAALLAVGVALSASLAVGFRDRVAAVALWYLWASLYGRNPLISNPSLPYIGWLLLAHACIPGSAYGSWDARGRLDPGGGWVLPSGIFACAWLAMALGYSFSGYTKLVSPSWIDGTALERVLENPLARPSLLRSALLASPRPLLSLATWGALGLELAFGPLALVRRARPWIWSAALAMHVAVLALIDFADLTFGMIVVHFFTFDPAWVRAGSATRPLQVFYDGHCGLCHGAVRFLLAEDASGAAFRFAPLGGATFEGIVPVERRGGLSESIVVVTESGELKSRSAGVLALLERLGGLWRVLAKGIALVPKGFRDAAYDFVASIRGRLFAAPADVCPMMPRELRARFDP